VLAVQQVPAHGPRPAAGPAEAALAIESPASSELDEARAARAESWVPAERVRETDGVAEVPRLNQFLNRALERFDAVRLGEFSPAEQLRQLEQIDARMTRVIGLAGRPSGTAPVLPSGGTPTSPPSSASGSAGPRCIRNTEH
jgi:hypothetical protein